MKNSRIEFLKKIGITGATLASAGIFGCTNKHWRTIPTDLCRLSFITLNQKGD